MKTKLFFAAILLASTLFSPAATNDLSALLQQGLLDEEASHDLHAAIADYQSLAAQFDKDRQVAATAIYRLGECYRKLGRDRTTPPPSTSASSRNLPTRKRSPH